VLKKVEEISKVILNSLIIYFVFTNFLFIKFNKYF
jgi:hypothetical protein